MGSKTVTLDVRDDINQGREPFSKIMGMVARLCPDENLRLVAPFEPIPLYSVLAKQGFAHAGKQLESGDWEVLFTRSGDEPSAAKHAAPAAATRPSSFVDVDARGLEPPQPMVKILEALATLPAEAGIRARTDRRPMHLYAHLEERGFAGETVEQTDGSFLTHIHRR